MVYFVARTVESDDECLYKYNGNRKVKNDDVVVVPNYQDLPVTAIVVKIVGRYQALTSRRDIEEIIDVVDIKEWNDKRLKEVDKAVMVEKMQTKISEIKMLEQLEKYAGKDPEMLELLNEYKGQSSFDDEPSE